MTERRMGRRVTQAEFLEMSGSKAEKKASLQTTMANYESGQVPPSLDLLARMAKLAGVDFENCISLPDEFKKRKDLHTALDEVLNDSELKTAAELALVGWQARVRAAPKKAG
jgi:transcriptional regulator with XRE-family HTH domain